MIKTWEEKIIKKRKKTTFKQFVKEILSWSTLGLYKINGKISRYSKINRVGYLDNKESINAGNYYIEYDFNKGFFSNFKKLFLTVPLQYIMDFGGNENSEFADCVFGTKNAYLTFVSGLGVENIFYSAYCYLNSSNIINSIFTHTNCNNIYMGAGVTNSYNIFYSRFLSNCSNIWFSTNLIGCQECIFCDSIENKKYCIGNKEYSKEDYFESKKDILSKKDKFMDSYLFIHKNPANTYLSENTSGKFNIKCVDVENSYWGNNLTRGRNIVNGGMGSFDFYDCFDVGYNSNDFYGVNGAGLNSKNLFCSTQIDTSYNIYYSYFLKGCSFCIGCVGLKNKHYCIFNKEYKKEEWKNLANKIFEQMENDGILGEFFPGEINPFYFNDTMAYLFDNSFEKKDIINEGYLWREEKITTDITNNSDIIFSHKELGNGLCIDDFEGFDANGNWQINPEIMKKIIKDKNGNFYKIVKQEYDFLLKNSLPIPNIHWLDRMKLGMILE